MANEPVTVQVLQDVLQKALQQTEKNILDKVNIQLQEILQPMADQINDMAKTLEETSEKAETALTLSKEIQAGSDSMKERILLLEAATRKQNVKFRGFQEDPAETPTLLNIMTTWLAEVLQCEEDDPPVILKAYRIGNPNKPNRKYPRDIMVHPKPEEPQS
ncbi:UNVERIFIED_CONTAM: hypothetical protein K2H54_034893 [Gekko kuhli]